jgi:hypothetical protein
MQSYKESQKDQAAHPPQDWDGYGDHCRAQQDHTHDEYKNIFVKHDQASFLLYFLFGSVYKSSASQTCQNAVSKRPILFRYCFNQAAGAIK